MFDWILWLIQFSQIHLPFLISISFSSYESTKVQTTSIDKPTDCIETPTTSSTQTTSTQDKPTPSRNRNTSGHKVGVNKAWLTVFSFTTATDESGNTIDVMLCKLCKKHKSYDNNGNKTWSETGYKCLRCDKLMEHQDSDQH